MSVLEVRDLTIRYPRRGEEPLTVVRKLNLRLEAGQLLGLVGESGSGKSQTALAILGLLDSDAIVEGQVIHDGRDLLKQPEPVLRGVRGNRVAMIFQDPMTSLNPHLTIGTQLAEVLRVHRSASSDAARAEAIRMLQAVRIPAASRRMGQYPHQLSGGMRQRVMIAMALMCRPQVLLADEPTTALDVTIQAQVLELLDELRREFGLSILMITHDLGVVAQICDRVMVMYAGSIMESGSTRQLLSAPGHPYTRGLLESLPDLDAPAEHTLRPIPGQPPNLAFLPGGCPFRPRCGFETDGCADYRAPDHGPGDDVRACLRSPEEVARNPVA